MADPATQPIKTVGLIAGGGRFPFEVARSAKRQGYRVVCAGIRLEVDDALRDEVDVFQPLGLLSFGKFVRFFRKHGARQLSWAGWIRKERLFSWRGIFKHLPDLHFFRFFLTRLPRLDRQSQTLLNAMVREFEDHGMEIMHSTQICPDLLVAEGPVTPREPSGKQLDDIAFGWRIAKRMAELDVGQSVCVCDRATIAVEGMEGTDRNILRAGELCAKPFVVVKLAMDGHDMRFDIPTIGPQTIRTMAKAGAAVLAIEAHRTLILERDEVLALAKQHKIAIVALSQAPATD